jgi:signal transduction histidine kinase
MSSHSSKVGKAPVEERDNARYLYRIASSIAYITLVLGYLLSILQASSLNVANFVSFTALQIAYAVLLWLLVKSGAAPRPISQQRAILYLLGLSLLTIGSGLFGAIGLNFDWLLYLVTLSLFFVVLPLRSAIIGCVLLYAAIVVNIAILDTWHFGANFFQTCFTLLPAFFFVAVFSQGNHMLEMQKTRSEQLLRQLEVSNAELEQAHAQLQAYANEVEELTIVRERTRVAREIHDTLGHYLSILNIQLETISKLQERDPERAKIEVEEARQVAAQSMQEVRNAVAALRPTSIANLNLTEALTRVGKEFEQHAQETELTLDLDTQLPQLTPDISVALYRVAQESLTNVRKHAHATKILLRLRYEENTLELVIRDNGNNSSNGSNGNGLASKTVSQQGGGFGLIGLRERIDLLGGTVTYGPVEPQGFRVMVRVPVATTMQEK